MAPPPFPQSGTYDQALAYMHDFAAWSGDDEGKFVRWFSRFGRRTCEYLESLPLKLFLDGLGEGDGYSLYAAIHPRPPGIGKSIVAKLFATFPFLINSLTTDTRRLENSSATLTPKHRTPTQSRLNVELQVADILRQALPALTAPTPSPATSTFSPPPDHPFATHVAGLKIPMYKGRPTLLLHQLGERQWTDASALFDRPPTERVCAMYNVSGAGKTRTVLEGLCSTYGIYMTMVTRGNHGSADLEAAMEHMQQHLVNLNKLPEGLDAEEETAYNEDAVSRHLCALLLSRLLILSGYVSLPSHGECDVDWSNTPVA